MYIISACLLGDKCKYNGKSNLNEKVLELCKEAEYVKVCPEVLGGLSTPRTPSEIVGDRVMTKDGQDVTEEFRRGAQAALEIARKNRVKTAILKANSPSCGAGAVYDGTFSGNLREGFGMTAKLLKENGVELKTEKDLED